MTRPRRRRADVGPRPLAASLDEAVSRLMPPGGPEESAMSSPASVLARWSEIAGPTVARHVQPVRLSADVLVVSVDQPAWATQVRAMAASILSRVGEVTGRPPSRLEVTVQRPAQGPPSRPGRDGVG